MCNLFVYSAFFGKGLATAVQSTGFEAPNSTFYRIHSLRVSLGGIRRVLERTPNICRENCKELHWYLRLCFGVTRMWSRDQKWDRT